MKVNSELMRIKILNKVKEYPKASSDDKLLISLIWKDEGWENSDGLYENLQKVSSPETIRRTRQKLTEEGLIKPTEKVQEERYKEFKQARFDVGGFYGYF